MNKHTPGPWIYYADTPSIDPNWHIVTTENRQRVIANVHIEPGNDMDAANARLIAAAPVLLEASIRLVAITKEFNSLGEVDMATLNRARRNLEAAIAQAEGRE